MTNHDLTPLMCYSSTNPYARLFSLSPTAPNELFLITGRIDRLVLLLSAEWGATVGKVFVSATTRIGRLYADGIKDH
jgi:hypothetical protein